MMRHRGHRHRRSAIVVTACAVLPAVVLIILPHHEPEATAVFNCSSFSYVSVFRGLGIHPSVVVVSLVK